jgi:hypothetical protein
MKKSKADSNVVTTTKTGNVKAPGAKRAYNRKQIQNNSDYILNQIEMPNDGSSDAGSSGIASPQADPKPVTPIATVTYLDIIGRLSVDNLFDSDAGVSKLISDVRIILPELNDICDEYENVLIPNLDSIKAFIKTIGPDAPMIDNLIMLIWDLIKRRSTDVDDYAVIRFLRYKLIYKIGQLLVDRSVNGLVMKRARKTLVSRGVASDRVGYFYTQIPNFSSTTWLRSEYLQTKYK